MTNWTLHGSGRNDHDQWQRLHQHTHDWTAAWADNEGFHLEPMPTEAPNATHLWAWTTGSWLRVRLDVPHWWAAMLTTPTTGGGTQWEHPRQRDHPAERERLADRGGEGIVRERDLRRRAGGKGNDQGKRQKRNWGAAHGPAISRRKRGATSNRGP